MIGKNILVFTKMHGAGNDYIYINAIAQPVADPENLAVRLSDRHFGIGGDGIVLIKPSRTADFFMDMYNADGSRGKMCGNAIRCVAKYVHDRRLTDKTTLEIETLSGIKTLELHLDDNRQVATVTVNMGAPVFAPDQIPVRFAGEKMIEAPVEVDGQTYKLTSVSMGNPHTVIFTTGVKDLDLARVYVTTLLSDQSTVAVKALNAMAVEFRRELSRTLKMRRVPELRFLYDDSVDRGERIESLLRGDG